MPRRPLPPKDVQLACLLALPPALRSELDRLLWEQGYRQAVAWLRERHGIVVTISTLGRYFRSYLPLRFLSLESAKGRVAPDFLTVDLEICLGRHVVAHGTFPLPFRALQAEPSPAPASASDAPWPVPDLYPTASAPLNRSAEHAEAL